jgi:PEP-CTERM motif
LLSFIKQSDFVSVSATFGAARSEQRQRGGTFSAGTSYYFNLVYDDRIVDTSDPSITKTQFYDIGTTGYFTTAVGAVPEPSTRAMLIVGLGGIGAMTRRRALAAAKTA